MSPNSDRVAERPVTQALCTRSGLSPEACRRIIVKLHAFKVQVRRDIAKQRIPAEVWVGLSAEL